MTSSQNIAIEAATDGACSGNPGKGGWGGLILFEDGSELEIGGFEKIQQIIGWNLPPLSKL